MLDPPHLQNPTERHSYLHKPIIAMSIRDGLVLGAVMAMARPHTTQHVEDCHRVAGDFDEFIVHGQTAKSQMWLPSSLMLWTLHR